jgi:hypothetical protein
MSSIIGIAGEFVERKNIARGTRDDEISSPGQQVGMLVSGRRKGGGAD